MVVEDEENGGGLRGVLCVECKLREKLHSRRQGLSTTK
jgi:hypothetical protein